MFELARRNKSETRWLPPTAGNETGQGACSDLEEAKRCGHMVIPPEKDGWAKPVYLGHWWPAASPSWAGTQSRRAVKWHGQKLDHRTCYVFNKMDYGGSKLHHVS